MRKSIIAFFTAFLLCSILTAQSWQDVGGGTNNSSHGLLVWNGQLVNLGSFNNPCNRVAVWDGTNWSCLGGGVGIVARAGCVWNGKLVVVGDFWNNFQPCAGCNGVAVWDGTSWTALDQGFNNDVLTCTVFNGDLIIGGDFTEADGVPIGRVARWNDVTLEFETIGSNDTIFNNDVRCMVEFNGELWVGGDFNNAGGCSPCDRVVKWDGTNWVGGNSGVDIIGGVDSTVRVLYVNPNDNNLYMGGHFIEIHDGDAPSPDPDMSRIAMYDGSNWYPLGTGLNQYCRAISEYNGNIIAGGIFTTAGGVSANKIAKWNGTTWSAMGQGFDGVGVDEYVKSAVTWNGIFFAGGAYTQAEGGPMNYIAQWYESPSQPPVAAINLSTNSICTGSCVTVSDNSTNSPTSWTWSFPGGSPSSSTSSNPGNVCYATAGTYTITLTACNGNGCNTTTQNVTVSNAPNVSVNSITICEGSNGTLTATGATSYSWSPATGLSATTGTTVIANPAITTTYTVTGTTGGCTGNAIATVTVNPNPTAASSNSGPYCEGEDIQLSALGGTNYSWTGPNGFTSTQQNPLISSCTSAMAGNYTVTVSDGTCSDVSTTVVTVNAAPTAAASNSGAYCVGDDIQLSASGGTSYNWTGPNSFSSTQQNPLISSSTSAMAGNYTVTVSDGTCSAVASTNVIVNTAPTASSSNNGPYCEGDDIQLSASGGTNYSWTGPNGFTSTQQNPLISFSTSAMAGTYTVTVSTGTCSDVSTTSVLVNAAPNATSSNSGPYCEGDDIQLSSAGGTNYSWTGPNSFTSTQQNPLISSSTSAMAGNYIVTVSDGTCSDVSTTLVTVNSAPNAAASNNGPYCEGDNIQLSASGGTSYSWTGPNSFTSTQQNPLISSSTSAMAGTYTVTVSNGNCSDISSTSVVITSLPANTITVNGFQLISDQNTGSWQWVDCNNGMSTIAGETAQTFDPTVNGDYAVIVSENGCSDTSACVNVNGLSVGNNLNENLFSVYPNPVNENLTIENYTGGNIRFQLNDATGKLVLSGTLVKGKNTILMNELSRGVYLLYIDYNSGVYQRVVKQ